jgi:2-hydroxychromene-2-carboxylate isomerase
VPSSLVRRLLPAGVAVLASARTRSARRALAEARRRLRREPHRVLYFHQVDDPYSHLASQVLARLAARYDAELLPLLVGAPPDAAAPERERLVAYARKDAADVAPFLGLRFPSHAAQPEPTLVHLATRILAGASEPAAFLAAAPRVGTLLWDADRAGLEVLARDLPAAGESETEAALARGSERRRELGHYLGATFHYGGEWYWGVDRLAYLEQRLDALGLRRSRAQEPPLVPVPGLALPEVGDATGAPLTLEFFASLRSPYTYVAMERTFALAQRTGVQLVLRPVLPMVMRGLPVPREKRLYILLDTKREAERAGVPFGRVCDPVGRPVERAYSLFPWARERGRAAELLLSFARGAFAEGIDTGTDAGLRRVVERAGLAWREALPHLDSEAWRDEVEANRRALLDLGLWGVPSFRLRGGAGEPDFCTWGQDRIWLVQAEIRRRAGDGAPRPATLPAPWTSSGAMES